MAIKAVRVVDFGCGTGFVSNQISDFLKHDSRLCQVDCSKVMLGKAKRPGCTQIVADPQLKNLQNLSNIDFFCMNRVLHHVMNHRNLYKIIYKVLAPRGQVVICGEQYNGIVQPHRFFEKRLNSREIHERTVMIKDLLMKCGITKKELSIKEIIDTLNYWEPRFNKRKTDYTHFANINGFNVVKYGVYSEYFGELKIRQIQAILGTNIYLILRKVE